MGRIVIPPPELVPTFISGVLGALSAEGAGPDLLQLGLIQAVVDQLSDGNGPRVRDLSPVPAAVIRAAIDDPRLLRQLANMVIVLELSMNQLSPSMARHAEGYLLDVGVRSDYLAIVRDTAEGHLVRLHADLLRNSWYTEQTIKGIFDGRLAELVRSKLSYYSLTTDRRLAARWRSLRQCPDGSWGREVARFYDVHGFPLPGEPGGIYEIGALHDWVHVLADYDTSPEGELDVFAFIAATMGSDRGFVQFVFTLALFQNASVTTVGGKRVAIARSDTLSDPGALDRLADAFRRATECTADVMGGVDHFELAATPVDELRERWSITPKGVPGPGAFDPPGWIESARDPLNPVPGER